MRQTGVEYESCGFTITELGSSYTIWGADGEEVFHTSHGTLRRESEPPAPWRGWVRRLFGWFK